MKLLAGTVLATTLLTGSVFAQETTLRMQTIEASLGQAITMATFANVVTNHLDGVSIEVASGGAATLHQIETARGNLDMFMTSPIIHVLMSQGRAMYANEPEAPALAENIRLLMLFPYGEYHYAVRSDSDIEYLDDIEGATVFIGPQGGGAYNTANAWIEATTGLVAGEDYEAITSNWQTGFQAFLDGTIDMYVNGCLDPCQQFIQFTETESVRFIGPETVVEEDIEAFLQAFRSLSEVGVGLYENQTNETPVVTHDTSVGIGVRADLDEELVYQITRAFWENLDSITSDAPWAAALDPVYASQQLGTLQLHAGAERYYREAGYLN